MSADQEASSLSLVTSLLVTLQTEFTYIFKRISYLLLQLFFCRGGSVPVFQYNSDPAALLIFPSLTFPREQIYWPT